MHAAEIRALLISKKQAYKDYEGSLPRFPELDGELGLIEVSAADGIKATEIATGEDGKVDSSLQLASMVIDGLVQRTTKEHIFSETDLEMVASFGMSVLAPIARQIKALSGLDNDAIEQAKKNLPATPSSGSATPLQGSLEEEPATN